MKQLLNDAFTTQPVNKGLTENPEDLSPRTKALFCVIWMNRALSPQSSIYLFTPAYLLVTTGKMVFFSPLCFCFTLLIAPSALYTLAIW